MIIPRAIVNEIFEHGKREMPIEACGYLAGKDGRVSVWYPMKNVDESREHYSLDPHEQFATVKKARNEGLDILAVYHTHPETPARPSVEDIALAYDPTIFYVIASLAQAEPSVNCFRIRNGEVQSEEMEMI